MMQEWLKDKLTNLKADLKRAWLSLTIWFNGVISAIISALLALPIDSVIAYVPQFQPYISDQGFRTAMVILLAVNGINIALRFKTTKALKDK